MKSRVLPIYAGLARSACVFYDREESTCLYFSGGGVASLYKINPLGEKKVIFVYGPGNCSMKTAC